MAYEEITSAEVDVKSPLDDRLLGKIKGNFDDLNERVVAAGATPFLLELQGRLTYISDYQRSVCMGIVNKEFAPIRCRFMLKKSGTSGTLRFDIRKHTAPRTPITGIDHQYSGSTQSIAQAGSALNTQSIARFVAQISTQSITHAKAAKNVQSIIVLGDIEDLGEDLVQYNLDATIDADTIVGDYITFSSSSSAANDGTYPIVEKNRGGGNNVVIHNPAGVAQTAVAGSAQEKIMSYNFTNPVSTSGFTAGYSHDFASHSNAANDGDLLVYKVNEGGNNVWVKNQSGVVQAGVAGTLDSNFWTFALGSAASSTDYIVGEYAKTASHSSGGNNAGALEIIAVNSGGNNLILHNASGVVQGGVAGTINTNRWVYSLSTDPSSQITAADTVYLSGHTAGANDGTFVVKEVNRGAANNVVVYNESGVAQGGILGSVYTTRKLIKFSSDQSANYSTSSYIEMQGLVDSSYNYFYSRAPFRVLQVNRGGGANYNLVIDNPEGASQASPSGYVQVEMKSVFDVLPSLAASATSLEANLNIVGESTDLSEDTIAAQTPLMLYITEHMAGDPRDLTITLL